MGKKDQIGSTDQVKEVAAFKYDASLRIVKISSQIETINYRF